jgi:maltose O-acetyltransferase
VLIGPDVNIYTAIRPILPDERIDTEETGREAIRTKTAPVTIGNRVWIGEGTVILPGVTIGDNAVNRCGKCCYKANPCNIIAFGNLCTVKNDVKQH